MTLSDFYQINVRSSRHLFLLNAELKDYARAGFGLLAQRVAIYVAALLLVAFYYSIVLAAIAALVLIVSEWFDRRTYHRIMRLKKRDVEDTRKCFRMVLFSTILSAANIAGLAVSIALLQGHTTHFMSLFFLFAAGLFATMNNNQIKPVLHLRLAIYLAAFLFIPLYDIIVTSAPLSSELWAQFFTSIFVMFFIVDSSRVSTGLYAKRLEHMEEIKREHEKTKAAYTAKSQFLATVSHELRTPLTSIKGSIDLIAHGAFGKLPDQMENTLNIAQRNATRLNTLINDLLDLQKLDAGRMNFDCDTLSVASLLSQAVSSNQPFATSLDVELSLASLPDDLYVYGDAARLEQVVSNILSNAAKFSNAGDTVTINAKPLGDKWIRVEVSDHGIGLNDDDRETVFERFSQLDSSDRRKIGGTGLGMNISKRIVDAHCGNLDYYKNEGEGTTFYIDLPRIAGATNTPARDLAIRSDVKAPQNPMRSVINKAS